MQWSLSPLEQCGPSDMPWTPVRPSAHPSQEGHTQIQDALCAVSTAPRLQCIQMLLSCIVVEEWLAELLESNTDSHSDLTRKFWS